MTRRRTIGDNPLDSITVPAHSGTDDQKPGKPRAEHIPVSTRAEAKTEDDDKTQSAEPRKSSRCGRIARMFNGSKIRILGGDVAPFVTRLTVPYLGESRGFRLANNEFIALKRDIVRMTVQSEETIRRTGKLLLWSAVGALLAGPFGALAGSLYGGWARHVTYVEMLLADGRKVIAAIAPETVSEIQNDIA
jgi:hypothetical protein